MGERIGESDDRATSAPLLRCAACGTVGFATDRYCPACGTPMPPSCPACGAAVEHLIARYCTQCGKGIGGQGSGVGDQGSGIGTERREEDAIESDSDELRL